MKGTGRLDFTTSFRAISSAVRVLGLHPSCRGFESLIAHLPFNQMYMTSFLQKLHRTVYPHNTLHIPTLKRGQWYDVDTKMFEAMFTLLCEYVENECAHMELMDTKKYSRWTRLQHRWIPRKFRKALSRELGLANLDWMANVENAPQHQVDMSQMTKELYLWYNDEYPQMKDPYETVIDPQFLFVDENNNPTNDFASPTSDRAMNRFHPDYRDMLDTLNAMEEAQQKTIDMKLEDLLAVRRSLWT